MGYGQQFLTKYKDIDYAAEQGLCMEVLLPYIQLSFTIMPTKSLL